MKVDFKKATTTVLQEKNYRNGFIALSILMFAAYIVLPVVLTPGNSIGFQLHLLRPIDFVVFVLLSTVTALLMVMQLYVHNRAKKKQVLATAGKTGVSLSSAIFGGLLATAACSSCIAGLLGFLGAGSVLFIVENQLPFVIGAISIVLIGLYFTSKRVNNACSSCEVHLYEK